MSLKKFQYLLSSCLETNQFNSTFKKWLIFFSSSFSWYLNTHTKKKIQNVPIYIKNVYKNLSRTNWIYHVQKTKYSYGFKGTARKVNKFRQMKTKWISCKWKQFFSSDKLDFLFFFSSSHSCIICTLTWGTTTLTRERRRNNNEIINNDKKRERKKVAHAVHLFDNNACTHELGHKEEG